MSILLGIIGVILLFTIPLKRSSGELAIADWTTFKFYTTDSNILLIIASIIMVIYISLLWKGKIKKLPQWVTIFKLIATATVTLTMFITVFFLTPISIYGISSGQSAFPPETLYLGSNMLFHIVCPSVAIVTYLLFEDGKNIKLAKTTYSLIPTLAYGVFYMTMAYTHLGPNGIPLLKYDWYSFCHFGPVAAPFMFIGVTGIYYLFTWLLWLGNRKINIKTLA